MSSDLGRGRTLDDAPGTIGVRLGDELPALPDEAMTNATAGGLIRGVGFVTRHGGLRLRLDAGRGRSFSKRRSTSRKRTFWASSGRASITCTRLIA
jgi:hypothetical protein